MTTLLIIIALIILSSICKDTIKLVKKFQDDDKE